MMGSEGRLAEVEEHHVELSNVVRVNHARVDLDTVLEGKP